MTNLQKTEVAQTEKNTNSTMNSQDQTKKEIRMILTQKCNYDCNFCHKEGLEGNESALLNAEDYRFIYRVGKDAFGFNTTSLSGGEPLMRKDIFDIAREIKEEGAYITMVSNGALLARKPEIGEYLDRINISIHSLDEWKYKELIGKNQSLQTVIDGIKKIKDHYPHIEIRLNSAFVKGLNAKEEDIINYMKLAQDLGASIKYIELFPRQSEKFVDLAVLEKALISYGFTKEEKAQRNEFRNGPLKVILSRITCSEALHKENPGEFCNNSHDLFLSPDGNIKLCRDQKDQIEFLNIIKMKDFLGCKEKLGEAINALGSNCIYSRFNSTEHAMTKSHFELVNEDSIDIS